jgi:hypothetical protein
MVLEPRAGIVAYLRPASAPVSRGLQGPLPAAAEAAAPHFWGFNVVSG